MSRRTDYLKLILLLGACFTSQGEAFGRPTSQSDIKLGTQESNTINTFDLIFSTSDENLKIFENAPNTEASSRFRSLYEALEEKQHYQLDTNADMVRYQSENQQLALWYAKAILKGFFKNLANETRKDYKKDRERDKSRERAQAEDVRQENPSRHARRAPASVEPETKPSFFSKFILEASGFFDRLTDQGIAITLPAVAANIRLDAKTTVFETHLQSPLFNVVMNYQMPFGDRAAAFGRPLIERVPEQFAVGGARYFTDLGVSAFVNYQLQHQHLSCALTRKVIGPLSAQVLREWGFVAGESESSVASLNISMSF